MQTCNSLRKQNARLKNVWTARKTWWLRLHRHVVVLLHRLLNCDVLCLHNHLKCLKWRASCRLNVKVVSCSVLFWAHVRTGTCAASLDGSAEFPVESQMNRTSHCFCHECCHSRSYLATGSLPIKLAGKGSKCFHGVLDVVCFNESNKRKGNKDILPDICISNFYFWEQGMFYNKAVCH